MRLPPQQEGHWGSIVAITSTLSKLHRQIAAIKCKNGVASQRLVKARELSSVCGGPTALQVSEEEERVVCHILHSAEFCRETLEGLAAAIQKDIKPAYADKVTNLLTD